uniref:Myoinhibitory peptide n=1 Tax=Carausius morosus TaxID=7022 RepID=A0A6G4ZU61_CARMO|nr:allatostatin-B transcript b [Carausius morosus]
MATSVGLLGLMLLVSIAPCSLGDAVPEAGRPQQLGDVQPARPQPPTTDEDKRAWQDLQGAWGKRGWQDLQAGWGKRAWQDLGSAWGKRAWQDLNTGWGKRGWQDLQSGWGKRAWQDLQGGWGKRAWDDLRPMWGKRYLYPEPSDDETAEDDALPVAAVSLAEDEDDQASDDKRAWRALGGAWGKRSADWANFRGMKEEPGASSSEE